MPITTDESSSAFGIEFTPSFVREVGEGALARRIPVETIRRCQIRYGSISKRPRLQLFVGLAMFSAVYFVFKMAIALVYDASRFGGRVTIAAMFVTFVGAWLVFDALKKDHYLFVATETEEFHLRLLQPWNETSARVLRESAERGSALRVEMDS